MSLVAYEGSSSDDDENEAPASPKSITTKSSEPSKQRETVKITIPSLDQFQDDEDLKKPEIKKPQYKSGSGLFSVLPPPKYSTESSNFKPHILTKKKAPPKKAPPPKPTPKEPAKQPAHTVSNANTIEEDETSDNESSEPESTMDFFSLDSKHVLPEITDLPDSSNTLFGTLPKPAQKDQSFSDIPEEPVDPDLINSTYDDDEDNLDYAAACEEYAAAQQQGASGSSSQSSFLEDEGFKKLKGRREKDAIEFIDVNAADQMTGKDEWLLQSLTEERVQRPSKRRGDMPSSQQRRKHQITYLAFQAKERELDLKNHWASNSRTRRETQAKYGF